jgi:uncharacterized membrane protein
MLWGVLGAKSITREENEMSILGKSGGFLARYVVRVLALLLFLLVAGFLMKVTKSPMLGAVLALALAFAVEMVLKRRAARKKEAESSRSGTWQKPK